jgi:Mn-dependent DtxR family transcriptional regulator
MKRMVTKYHKDLATQIVDMLGGRQLLTYEEICARMDRSRSWTSSTMRHLARDGIAQVLTRKGRRLVTLHPTLDAMAWDEARHWCAVSLCNDLDD